MNKECQVFISYSRKDKAIVDQVVADIERETHVRCWMDLHGIEGGTQFEEVIISAIDQSEVVLFCMSDNSMQSDWTKAEVRYAKLVKKRLVPINISGCQPTGWFLFTFGGTDVIDYANELHRDKLYRNLLEWFPEAARKAQEEAARIAKAEAERKSQEEAARLAKEEAERKAEEEAARLAKEEAERKAQEEAARLAKEEAERKAQEEAARIAKAEAARKAEAESVRVHEIRTENDALTRLKRHWLPIAAGGLLLIGGIAWLASGGSSEDTVETVETNAPRYVGQMIDGHGGVDLGIKDDNGKPIYWATCNVGADNPWEYGLYFAWGETEGYTSDTGDGRKFDRSSYKWCKGTENSITKYCIKSFLATVDDNMTLEPSDDAAIVAWGGNWRMPTREELEKLEHECYWKWVEQYAEQEVSGYIVYKAKSSSDKGLEKSSSSSYSLSDPHIFLPAAGYRYGSDLNDAGSYGYYWSSSLATHNSNEAYSFYFSSGNVRLYYYGRYYGQSVRPVCQ